MDKRRSKPHPLLACANPACGHPLDWAAPIYPREDTPKDRIHQVPAPTGPGRYFMCYVCGHYTRYVRTEQENNPAEAARARPIRITTKATDAYVDIVVETDAVNSAFLHHVLDEIEKARIRQSGQYLRLLLEVIAPELDVTLMQGLDVFRRATKMGLRGSQVAYVISGRPWSITATILESIARKRGIHLRFFVDRYSALSWLNNASEESGRIA